METDDARRATGAGRVRPADIANHACAIVASGVRKCSANAGGNKDLQIRQDCFHRNRATWHLFARCVPSRAMAIASRVAMRVAPVTGLRPRTRLSTRAVCTTRVVRVRASSTSATSTSNLDANQETALFAMG